MLPEAQIPNSLTLRGCRMQPKETGTKRAMLPRWCPQGRHSGVSAQRKKPPWQFPNEKVGVLGWWKARPDVSVHGACLQVEVQFTSLFVNWEDQGVGKAVEMWLRIPLSKALLTELYPSCILNYSSNTTDNILLLKRETFQHLWNTYFALLIPRVSFLISPSS